MVGKCFLTILGSESLDTGSASVTQQLRRNRGPTPVWPSCMHWRSPRVTFHHGPKYDSPTGQSQWMEGTAASLWLALGRKPFPGVLWQTWVFGILLAMCLLPKHYLQQRRIIAMITVDQLGCVIELESVHLPLGVNAWKSTKTLPVKEAEWRSVPMSRHQTLGCKVTLVPLLYKASPAWREFQDSHGDTVKPFLKFKTKPNQPKPNSKQINKQKGQKPNNKRMFFTWFLFFFSETGSYCIAQTGLALSK